MLGIEEIKKIIPHRHPFLLVDKIELLEPGKRVVAYKGVTYHESFFAGHFESKPVVPGVLIIEALAQAGCAAILSIEEYKGRLVYLGKISKAKFSTVVVPGDTIKLEVDIIADASPVFIATARASVDDKTVVTTEITFALQDKEGKDE